MRHDDCRFYLRGRCTALTELVCKDKECSFYKLKEKDADDKGENKAKA